MITNIKTTNITLTPAISDYAAKRLEKIENMLRNDPSVKCDVELGKTTAHHNKGDVFRAEIHIVGKDLNAYASIEKDDLYAAIDLVRDEIMREISGGKSKKVSLIRRSGARIKNAIRGIFSGGKSEMN